MSAERVTQALGALGTLGVLALVLVIRERAGSDAHGEALILFVVFAPAVGILCLAVLVTLGLNLAKGRVQLLTWIAAGIPALLALRLLAVLAGWPLSLELLNG